MRLPQIRMESQFANIGIKQNAGRQELSQPKADLEIQQPWASLSMETTKPKLTIDQTQAWEETNRYSIVRLAEVIAQEGRQALKEGMGRRAQQGTELLKIENKGSAIANQALVNGHPQAKPLGLTHIPSPFSVKIHFQPSELHINAQANQPIIDVQVNRPIHNYERGKVDIYMENYEQLHISYTNLFSESI